MVRFYLPCRGGKARSLVRPDGWLQSTDGAAKVAAEYLWERLIIPIVTLGVFSRGDWLRNLQGLALVHGHRPRLVEIHVFDGQLLGGARNRIGPEVLIVHRHLQLVAHDALAELRRDLVERPVGPIPSPHNLKLGGVDIPDDRAQEDREAGHIGPRQAGTQLPQALHQPCPLPEAEPGHKDRRDRIAVAGEESGHRLKERRYLERERFQRARWQGPGDLEGDADGGDDEAGDRQANLEPWLVVERGLGRLAAARLVA